MTDLVAGAAVELAGLRPTRQRWAVLRAVERLGVFAGAQSVHGVLDLEHSGVSLATVYRTLRSLEERGVLDTVRGADGEMMYRRCRDGAHHHLVCRFCGRAVELPASEVGCLVRRWAAQEGYLDIDHRLEVFGTCPECRSAADCGE